MAQELHKHILLIEDDKDIRNLLKDFLEEEGHAVRCAVNGKDAFDIISSPSERKFDVILSDVQMPLMDGITLIQKLKEMNNDTPIILMTAFGTVETAVEAIKKGAHDYLTKPIDLDDLKETLLKTFEYSRIVFGKEVPEKEITDKEDPEITETLPRRSNLIGESPAMKKIVGLVERIARVDSTVLILGESGVGKEVVAREIHSKSRRRNRNFVTINCAAIPAELLESELFGHSKGSFTGATAQKKGLFEEADGGTLFLDEIGDMPPPLQAKLLRVLQDRQIRAVGSNISKNLDVRIIAATHRDLRSAIVEGQFREDLFYRLSVIPMFIPPLRDRREDIRPLAIHFAKRASGVVNEGYKTFSEEALKKLKDFYWKGNIRELENAIERCLVMSPKNVIKPEDLNFLDENESRPPQTQSTVEALPLDQESLRLRDIEREAVILALKKTDGKKAEAAKLLGIDRKTLHRKEIEYELNS